MAFQGSLKELPLPDIIQLVSVSGKTGKFSLTSEAGEGEIHLQDGRIVHAFSGKLEGEEAVYEMAVWRDGDFVFVPSETAGVTTINKSNTNLLMEAARRLDEWQILSKRIPSTGLVPVFTDDSSRTSVSLTPQEWMVISKIDERRTIDELAIAIGTSPFEASKLLYGLITSGLIRLEETFSGIPIKRLSQLSLEESEQLSRQVLQLAQGLMQDQLDAGEVEKISRLYRAEVESGRQVDALIDLIRSLEKMVSTTSGPNRSKELLSKVADFLQA
ncbi:MAG: DUF4388 domain-containing protein [Acidobacteriota bacterium]|nr:DUF4388 domain-containing protein [Acidobacteriota bacterium]